MKYGFQIDMRRTTSDQWPPFATPPLPNIFYNIRWHFRIISSISPQLRNWLWIMDSPKKSLNFGCQLTLAFLEIDNYFFTIIQFSFAKWGVLPSCWTTCPSDYYYSIQVSYVDNSFTNISFKKYGPIILPIQNIYHIVRLWDVRGFPSITRGFSSPQIQQFCLLTSPSISERPSSRQIIF